jgi:hypothetical protein
MTRLESNTRLAGLARLFSIAAALALLLVPATLRAGIIGVTDASPNPEFHLTARAGNVSIADGGSIYSWGYGLSTASEMQLPGPTLIVNEGDTVTVTLQNALPAAAGAVSIVFPGHEVATSGGDPGLLTREAPNGGSVTYTFTASQPGTYHYHSGTRPDLQVEMGLYGALIVRPTGTSATCNTIEGRRAYDHPGACFDREYLFLLSEIDIDVHNAAQLQAGGEGPIDVGNAPHRPEYWLMNGRAGPDTMAAAGAALLPTQPYNAFPRMHPGERVLLRVVGAGHDMHPFHHHGNHTRVIARDGRMLVNGADQLSGPRLFTIPSVPGQTVDAIFEWTGKDLGWDIYGTSDINPHNCDGLAGGYHSIATDMNYLEWCADHYKPIPVNLPSLTDLAFGGFWSGSPYLGLLGSLPPGEGGLNPNAGYTFMWHSHTERELVNNDVFPGGMMTMMLIEARLPGLVIE